MSQYLSKSGEVRTDHELLEDFFRNQESEAFSQLVARHGPMILGTCLRLLSNQADAEDAFQATFLTLLLKGHSIRQKMALPNWLYRVAVRISLRQRSKAQKHSSEQLPSDVAVEMNPADEAAWREAAEVLDRELHGLPESYRLPLLLCCIGGRSCEEAAAELGCPVGTLAVRVMRGREMLRKRLVRRGLLLGASFLASQAIWTNARAAVSQQLLANTVASGRRMVAKNLSGVAISQNVQRILKSECAWWQSLRAPGPIAAISLAIICLSVGVFLISRNWSGRKYQSTGPDTERPGIASVAPLEPPPQQQQPPQGRFVPGLWLRRRNNANGHVFWAPAPPNGRATRDQEEIIGVAFVPQNFRPNQLPNGFRMIENLALFNCFVGI
jgi:RNA polymerase sigma factor (sigma-70 family)